MTSTENRSKHSDRDGAPGAGSSLEGRVRAFYEDLPESERRIADLILESPGQIAAYSATELAELSGGSKAAVTRLVRRLGFAGFEEARRAARDAQNWGSPLYLLSRDGAAGDFASRAAAQVDQDSRNIAATLEALRPETFDEVVRAVCDARRVFLLGYRNGYFIAGYARQQLVVARDNVFLLPAAGETLAEEIAGLTGDDVLIVVGFRRRIDAMRRVMAAAGEAGVRVLYVTDWTARPSPHATWTMRCAVHGQDVFDRYASAMSLMHFLCISVVDTLAAAGRGRIERIEILHEALHDFD